MRKEKITTLHEIISGRYVSPKHQDKDEEDYNTLEEEEKSHINHIIMDKYRTFTRWDFRKSLPPSKKRKSIDNKNAVNKSNDSITMGLSLLMPKNKSIPIKGSGQTSNKKSQTQKKGSSDKGKISLPPASSKKIQIVEPTTKKQGNAAVSAQQMGVKSDRRERFKKLQNPMQFIKHYMQKQNYSPTAQQKHLLEKLISVQKMLEGSHDIANKDDRKLDQILEKIYKLMNLAVDYNQLLFLALIVLLAADICFYLRDYKKSFYFYNQARIAGSYAHLDHLKIASLMGLGRIAETLQMYTQAKRLIRKALQYSWRISNENSELEIYDLYGQILHYEGCIRESKFYHVRFAHNILQPQNSALRKISGEMLSDYDSYIESLEDSNLDSLFIQYLSLPINSAVDVKPKTQKKFKNYNELGQSPRMKKELHDFSSQSFLSVEKQMAALLNNDFEFKMEIPHPDGYNDPSASPKRYFQNPNSQKSMKKELDFEHSIVFNRIVGKKPSKPNLDKVLKLPLQKLVEQKLQDKLDPQWYQHMVSDIKKKRLEKVGNLKQRVRNSHLSYHKYASQRKKSSIWNSEKINQSFNRTMLDWIDPQN